MAVPETSIDTPEIVLLPEACDWPKDLAAPTSEQVIRAREQLGIPVDRAGGAGGVVASGHQPMVFHPGIVTKLIAMDYWAKKTGSAALWIVPDQDVVDPGLVRVPDSSGVVLSSKDIRIGGELNQGSPAMVRPAIEIGSDLPEELESVGSWLAGYEHESSIARQFAHGVIGMLCEQLGLEEPTIVFASDLMGLDVSKSLLDNLFADPKGAIEAYNKGVERFPQAGVRPLVMTEKRIELPLWRVDGNGGDRGGRSAVFVDVDGKSEFDRTGLVPSGLLMTAIMRLAVCDLFIHGTGGYEYDQITDAWLQEWSGESLAPVVGASATMRLDLSLPEIDPDRAIWAAHHARHNPGMVGDDEAAKQKSELVAKIAELTAVGDRAGAAGLYSQLHQLLDASKMGNASELAELDNQAQAARKSRQAQEIANARTWAFPLYTDEQMQALKVAVVRALDARG